MIEMRAVKVLDGLEVVARCVHDVVTGEGHLLAHSTVHLETGGAEEVVGALADLWAGVLWSAQRGRVEWTEHCSW